MKKLILLTLSMLSLGASAQQATVSGPDGKLRVNFDVREGRPTYSVTYDGKQMLDESPLGFVANIGDFSQNITFVSADNGHRTDRYTMRTIKQSEVNVESNTLTVQLQNARRMKYTIVFNVSDNDIAFRYEIPMQPDRANEQKASIRIMKEATGFDLPHQATTFITQQARPMTGWKGTKPSYEEGYTYDAPMTQRSHNGNGFTFPALFHVDQSWVLISETGTDSRYCGCRLNEMTGDGLYTIGFPLPEENNGNGTIEPAFSLPGATPWRTITVGNSLKPIVETTVPWNYVEPRYVTDHEYKYGKSTWSWIVWQDGATNYDDQIRFIDLAHQMGYPYVLVDAGWDKNIGYERMEQLARYASSKGVSLFLWYSSSGWWNDIQQSPVNVMSNSIARKKDMRWMQKIGVKGIKVDFFGGDKQETMRQYEDILSDADDHGIMCIFHGCTLPRGWERMYPNYVGSEAVLASENIYFGQGAADAEANNTALHPFIRNTVGCMEFGGSFMNRHIRRGNKGGNTRRTSDAHEMAQAVLFQNPIQNFAITPENLITDANRDIAPNEPGAAAPQVSMDFLRQVPTTWDETQFIDGYPGKYCVIARRSGAHWYIAGNNATGAPLTLTLNLPMLQKGETVQLYSDNMKDREPQLTDLQVKKPEAIKVSMVDQGGFVIVK